MSHWDAPRRPAVGYLSRIIRIFLAYLPASWATPVSDSAQAQPAVSHDAPAAPSPTERPATLDERLQLYAVAAGYGALSGYGVHELTGARHWSTWVLPGAAVGAAALGAVAWIDAKDGWSLGQPQAIVTDTLIGSGIAGLWVWHDQARRPADEGWSPAVRATLLWSGATVGGMIGVLRYELSPSAPGQAAFTGSVAWWSGALSGLAGGALTSSAARRERNASLAAVLGLEGGIVLGSFLGRTLRPAGDWSIGWVRAVDGGALLGAAALGGSWLLLSNDDLDSRATLGFTAAGLVLGGAAGAWLAPHLGLPQDAGFAIVPEVSATHRGVRIVIGGE